MSDLLARAWEPIGKKILERLEYCIDFKKNSFSSAKSFSHKAWIPNSHFDDLIESQWQAVEPQCREYIAKAYDRGWNEEGRHPFAEGKAGRIAVIDSFEKEHVVDVLMLMVREVWEQSCDKAVLPRIKGTVQLLRDLDALSKRVKAKKADLSEADKKLMALAAELEQAEMERAIRAAVLDNAKDELIKQMQDYARQNPATMGITNEATAKSHHFGFLDWAKANGVGYYQVNAVLDGKTCKSCAAINGKKFKVEDALKFKERYLDCLGDKEALKSLTPYIKPSELNKVKGLTDEEIAADAKAHPKPTPTPSSPPPAPQAPPQPAKPKEPEPQKPVAEPKEEPKKPEQKELVEIPKVSAKEIVPEPTKKDLRNLAIIEEKKIEKMMNAAWDHDNEAAVELLPSFESDFKVNLHGIEIDTAKISDKSKVVVPILEKDLSTGVFYEKYKHSDIGSFKIIDGKGKTLQDVFDDYTFLEVKRTMSLEQEMHDANYFCGSLLFDREIDLQITMRQKNVIDAYKDKYHKSLLSWALDEYYPEKLNVQDKDYASWVDRGLSIALSDKWLQSIFNKPIPVGIVTHRGMNCLPRFLENALNAVGGNAEELVGKVCQSESFMSSSASEQVSELFANKFKMKFLIPKGTKSARYIDQFDVKNDNEYEVLLRRGAHFKVVEVNKDGEQLTNVTLLLLE